MAVTKLQSFDIESSHLTLLERLGKVADTKSQSFDIESAHLTTQLLMDTDGSPIPHMDAARDLYNGPLDPRLHAPIGERAGERNIAGDYQFRKIEKDKAPDCTVIGVIARNFIRIRRWRYGVTVSVVPYNKEPTANIWPHVLNVDSAIWGFVVLCTLGVWGGLTVKWLPTDFSTMNRIVEHGLTFMLHIVFMDLVPNWVTGLLLHRVKLFEHVHRYEHFLTRGGKISSVFLITSIYAWYTLMFMVLFGFGVACTSPSNKGCFHWRSSMWLASFSYAVVGIILRIMFWLMRHYPVMYNRYPLLLKMSRFYWAHFNFREWDGGLVFGAVTPFYDVVFGTCPFDIKWSCPIPFVDFLVTDQRVFKTVRNPERIRWTKLQWAWHMGWLVAIAGLVGLLATLQHIGYFLDQ